MRELIFLVIDCLNFLLIVRVLMSWIPHDRYHPIISIIYQCTEPILSPFRRMIPTNMGIDFSPIFAFVFLGILKQVIVRII